jgi:hypothetical protein
MKTVAAAAFSMMLVLWTSLASSAEVPFDQAQFDALRATGKPVAVVFTPTGARSAALRPRFSRN